MNPVTFGGISLYEHFDFSISFGRLHLGYPQQPPKVSQHYGDSSSGRLSIIFTPTVSNVSRAHWFPHCSSETSKGLHLCYGDLSIGRLSLTLLFYLSPQGYLSASRPYSSFCLWSGRDCDASPAWATTSRLQQGSGLLIFQRWLAEMPCRVRSMVGTPAGK